VAQTHGPTVAGAMEDLAIDEMPDVASDIVRRDGEPSQGFMNEGAWEVCVCVCCVCVCVCVCVLCGVGGVL
jgi:hypothetical protein